MRKFTPNNLRNLIFGIEDSLVSTFGVVFGVASVSNFPQEQIIVTGLITIVVEAASMGAGSFLTESEINEVDHRSKLDPAIDGVIMFFAYFFAGFIPLAPYIFFDTLPAKLFSIAFTLISLYILGYLPTRKLRSGFRVVLVAGCAALLGYLVAHFFSI